MSYESREQQHKKVFSFYCFDLQASRLSLEHIGKPTKAHHHMVQSANLQRTPVGIPFYWERGIDPPTDWPTWAATLKIAIIAKESLNVDTLLRYKPEPKDLFYPAEPTYEPPVQNETQVQKRERDQRNVKRKVDWENECKAIEFKGPLVDGIPWDEADTKVKSLIYFCIGTEGQRIYHQRFPHSNINTISAFELFHELSLSFTRPRNTTYDRFLLFMCKHKENEKLEIFHCRLKALGAQCRLGTAEDDLIKDLFIAFMNNTEIQSELLTETRTPAQVLQYALNKERGQENQRAIAGRLRATNILDNQIAHIGSSQFPQQRRRQPQNTRNTTQQHRQPQQQRNQGQPNPCRRCGAPFSLEHLQI